MRRRGILLSIVGSLALIGCFTEEKGPPTAATGTRGAISLRLSFDPASLFKTVAKTGTLTVSAADMSPLSAPLTIGDSTVTAEVSGIPAGKRRAIELKVYGDGGILGYRGSGSADIYPDSTTRVAIDLVRTTGSAEVVGRIREDTASTAWPAPVSLNLGAQGSPTLGAVLDVDQAQVWTSAAANADQGGIDLVFLYYHAAFHLDNAVTAKEAGVANNINLTNSYDAGKIKDIPMVKLATRPRDQGTAKRIFAASAKIQGSTISGGEIFLVESTEGKLALLTVMNITGTDARGTVEVRLEKTTLP